MRWPRYYSSGCRLSQYPGPSAAPEAAVSLRYRMWTTRVVVFYILTFVFTIILGGIQEAA